MIEVSLLVKFVSEHYFRLNYTYFSSGNQYFVMSKNCVFPHFSGLCKELNQLKVKFPGSNLGIHYEIKEQMHTTGCEFRA